MKYFLIILLTLGLMACSSSDEKPPVDDGTNPPPVEEPEGPIGYDDSYQKPFAKLSDQGLPMGECVNVGEQWSWQKSAAHKDMPNCSGQEAGQACSGRDFCKFNNLEALSCRKTTTHACHGWVFEKTPKEGGGVPDFKPLANAKAYVFWFSGCIVGICDPQSEVVTSDENGYFELITTTVKNQVRVEKNGYYSACSMNRPFKFSDAQIEHKDPKIIGGHVLLKQDASSCK